MLQNNSKCLESAVTFSQESFELLDALAPSLTTGSAPWHHIRRSISSARQRCWPLRSLLPGAGLGFALVHCKRTWVECCDNTDGHQTPLHGLCDRSDSIVFYYPAECVIVTMISRSYIKALDLWYRNILSNQLVWWGPLLPWNRILIHNLKSSADSSGTNASACTALLWHSSIVFYPEYRYVHQQQ